MVGASWGGGVQRQSDDEPAAALGPVLGPGVSAVGHGPANGQPQPVSPGRFFARSPTEDIENRSKESDGIAYDNGGDVLGPGQGHDLLGNPGTGDGGCFGVELFGQAEVFRSRLALRVGQARRLHKGRDPGDVPGCGGPFGGPDELGRDQQPLGFGPGGFNGVAFAVDEDLGADALGRDAKGQFAQGEQVA